MTLVIWNKTGFVEVGKQNAFPSFQIIFPRAMMKLKTFLNQQLPRQMSSSVSRTQYEPLSEEAASGEILSTCPARADKATIQQ